MSNHLAKIIKKKNNKQIAHNNSKKPTAALCCLTKNKWTGIINTLLFLNVIPCVKGSVLICYAGGAGGGGGGGGVIRVWLLFWLMFANIKLNFLDTKLDKHTHINKITQW